MNAKTIRYALAIAAALAAVAVLMVPDVAAAANAAGGGMPYSPGLTRFRTSLSGEVAMILIVIGLVGGGCMWIWGGEMSGMLAYIAKAIIVICIVGGVTGFMTSMGVTGALI